MTKKTRANLKLNPNTSTTFNDGQTLPAEQFIHIADSMATLDDDFTPLKTRVDTSIDTDGTLNAGAVDVTATLANAVVTGEKIASSTVTSSNIASDTIANVNLATDIKIGSLASLTTGVKSSAVAAINELQTEILTVDNRIDNIIASSGTSSTETVDARGDYTVLRDRLNDMTLSNNVMYVDSSFGANESTHGRFTTVGAAIAACSGGETIHIAPGIYTEVVAITQDGLKLMGSGQPEYDTGSGRLINGTIFRGRIRQLTATGLVLRDLGVDMVGINSQDAIESSNIYESAVHRTIENVTILGNGYDALAHGFYASGDYYQVRNLRVIDCYHGVAIHGRYGNFDNIVLESCASSSIIVKSKTTVGNVEDINISNVTIKGDAASASFKDWGGPIIIQASNGLSVKNVNVVNVTADTCANGVVHCNRLLADGVIESVRFTNVGSKNNKNASSVGDYWLRSGSDLVFVNCSSFDRISGQGWNADTAADNLGSVYLHGCTSDTSGSGAVTGTFSHAEVNGLTQRDTRYTLSTPNGGGFGQAIMGYTPTAGISVTGANTPVASLMGLDNAVAGYAGLVHVFVRSSLTSATNSSSYVLHVWREGNLTTSSCGLVSEVGRITSTSASSPAFTFAVDGTNNHLEATPEGSTSGTFFFSFVAVGFIRVIPVV